MPALLSGAGALDTWRATPPAARALLAGTFVNRLGGFLQVFAILYMTDRGFSDTQAAFALGAYGAGSIGGMLAGGWLSDLLGGRRTIVVSMACTAGLLLGVYYLGPYPAKIVLIALTGAVGQAYRPASASMLSDLVPPERRLMVFAMNRLAVNLGATALPLAGVALASVSYGLLFWGEALGAISYAVIAGVALPRRPASVPDSGPASVPDSGPASSSGAGADTSPGLAAAPALGPAAPPARGRTMLGDRPYLLFLAALLLHSVVYVQYLSTLPLAIRDHHMPVVVYAVLISVNGVFVITCELLVTRLVQGRPPRLAILGGMALTGLGMTLYAPPWGVAGMIVATLVWTLGEMAGAPSMYFAYPAQAGRGGHQGRYLGAANAMFGLANSLGPILGVAAWTAFGDGVWLLCGVTAVAAMTLARHGVHAGAGADRLARGLVS
ncbi:MFS transporter [Sphaerisporangium sp. NPDC049002]|uniref:MFS transporter n=1 Tax=Sphaerisporangium sp. NPDC049002 TaxID=3155392 RepID=UPI0033BFFE51